jgi:hypothetical protein
MVVFVDVKDRRLDPWMGISDPKGEVAAYLASALPQREGNKRRAFAYFFHHLDHPNPDISVDAWRELLRFSPGDAAWLASGMPPDPLVRLLQVHWGRSGARSALFGKLLGYCGTAKHADVLEKLIERLPEHSSLEGMWTAYLMLRPKQGLVRARHTLADRKRDFVALYPVLRALREVRDLTPISPSTQEIADTLCAALTQPDLFDLVIEDLRSWQCWDKAPQVLALANTGSFKSGLGRRAILRYCLSCPDEGAKKFIVQRRKIDADEVREREDELQKELRPPKKD